MMYFVYESGKEPRLMAMVKDLRFVRRFVWKRNAYYRTSRFFYTENENGRPNYCLTL